MLKLGRIFMTSGTEEHVARIYDMFQNLQAQVVDPDWLLGQSFDDSTWIFIDWLLPAMAGITLVSLLRASGLGRRARISMVLPSPDEGMQARALEAGADDYIVGPLAPGALVERMRIYHGSVKAGEGVSELGELSIDPEAFAARYRGSVLALSVSEFRLLSHFVRHPNRIFTRASLIGVLGKSGEVHEERTVDAWMSRLRSTLRRQGVSPVPRTVRAAGYILDA